jgi:hypothetical protein
MNTTQKAPKKNGGSSSPKVEAAAPKKETAAVPVPEKKGNGKAHKEEPKVQVAIQQMAAEIGGKEKKRKGRAPTEGEPLRRVLIFLGTKEIDALKAMVGDRGMSTKIREILKEHLSK